MSNDALAIKELERKLALQKKAFLKDQYPSIDARKENISKIAGMIMSNRDAIHKALNEDFGNHPKATSDLVEVLGVAGRAQYVISQIDEWTKPSQRHVDAQLFGESKAEIIYQPKGVVGVIVPWNFPMDLSLGPLCEILAGGNRCIIKPSEYTPATGALLEKMVKEMFPEDLVTVVNGGLDLSRAFSQQKFNHLLYTGSPEVAKSIMSEAAKNLVPVTLELGGKCPAVMVGNTLTQRNVDQIMQTKLLKNGSMCVTVDSAVVPKDKLEDFIQLAKDFFKNNGLDDYAASPDCTGMISERHYERIVSMVKEAEAAGVRTITLGGKSLEAVAGKRSLPLTLVVDPPANLRVSKEEIFGPIMPIVTYTNLDDAIATINDGERPLGLYIFTDDAEEAKRLVNETNSGGCSINSCAMQAALPSMGFGGSGNSGMGRHHGLEGFLEFTNPRGVFTRGPATSQDLIAAFGPPFSFGEQVAAGAYAAAGM
ncbi:aldehyde dehydrogenase [Protomyces lactucae-debilis]|uniref:Aldehyde dehydrogenase n=1 Tax=Protomyces lactucae-debilis TaxID=2754530 RepID=A0A1Y2FCB9_PROLT|nr:aldehyde dehydrogenase [Protomyces lactucae-debilis]ORY81551.1 aldehyde dehydrogenase [Protomyces lactucae-debilis]